MVPINNGLMQSMRCVAGLGRSFSGTGHVSSSRRHCNALANGIDDWPIRSVNRRVTSVTQLRHDLLVFSKKEIMLVFILLVLIALLSFTLGLRMGQQLAHISLPGGTSPGAVTAEPPLHEAPAPVTAPEGDEHGAVAAPAPTGNAPSATSVADAQLKQELAEEKVSPVRKVQTLLPGEKTGDKPRRVLYAASGALKPSPRLQACGALRRKGVSDAHYFAAQVQDKGTWYRVGIGSYASKHQAEAAG